MLVYLCHQKKTFSKIRISDAKLKTFQNFKKISQPKKTYLKKLFSGSGCEKLTKLIKTTAFIGLIFMNDD